MIRRWMLAAGVLVVLAGCGHAAPAGGAAVPYPLTASASPASGELVTGTGYTFRLPEGWTHDASAVSMTGAASDVKVDVMVQGPTGNGTLINELMVTTEPATTVNGSPGEPSPGFIDNLAVHSDEPFVLAGIEGRAVTFSYSVGAQRLVSRHISCVHDGLRVIASFITDGSDPGPGLHAVDELLASWTWTTG